MKIRACHGSATAVLGGSDSKITPKKPTAIAMTAKDETASPSTTRPISAVKITSVLHKVTPMAKLRRPNKATTQAVANIWAMAPVTA